MMIKNRADKRQVTLAELPLFASEFVISIALMGPDRYNDWQRLVPLLERRGFPTVDALMDGRYTPAIKAFFDSEYGLSADRPVASRDGPEALGTWPGHKKGAGRSRNPR